MSWLVERLLVNYYEIKQGYVADSEMCALLISLEVKIDELRSKGLLNDEEDTLIAKLKEYYTVTELSKDLGLSRISTSTKIDRLMTKLALCLGGIYTDEGYSKHLAEVYDLNDVQTEQIKLLMTGKYKRTYMR